MVGLSMSCVIRTAGAHVGILESIQVTFCFLGLLQVFILAHFLFLFFGWKAYRGWRVSLEFGVVLGFSLKLGLLDF